MSTRQYYQRMKREIIFKYMLIVFGLIITSCGNVKKEEQKEVILARVGDKTISLNEFIRRAEYTIRPPYCKGDNNIHKKIILNSLVAEKMLALEAGETNELVQNKAFQNHIKGRQEQAMREWLLHKEGFQKVRLEESEIRKVYDVAGRTYNVQYIQIPDDSIAGIVKKELHNNERFFEATHQQLWGENDIPEREVSWKSKEHPMIHEALFSNSLTKGQIVGPLRIDEDFHIVMKILGWTDKLAVMESDQQQRWNDVKEKLTEKRAMENYDKYVGKIMGGKKLEFDQNTFYKMVKLISPLYMRSPEEKRDLFLKNAFNRDKENPELHDLGAGIEELLDNSFFRVEDRVWSVRDFKEELQRHPLVFRKKIQKKSDFAKQFKLAIVDMVRDRYMTQEAYKRGYQHVNVVKRHTQMWRDALLALHQKYQYLEERIPNLSDSLNAVAVIEEYLNPYIDELQEKYSDRVEVNVHQFNDIQLTRIDMFVTQQNVPFPVLVPAFPSVTTDYKLDYGKRIE